MSRSNPLNKSWLIIANGEPAAIADIQDYASHRKILAIDGGTHQLQNTQLSPDVIIGDLDSIDSEYLHQLEQTPTCLVQKCTDQNKTDLEKAIEYVDAQGTQDVLVLSATGLCTDHTLYNLRLLKRFYRPQRSMSFMSIHETIHYIQDQTIWVDGDIGSIVSIMGFSRAKLCSEGLAYDRQNHLLGEAGCDSVRNRLSKPRASIKISGNALVFIGRGSVLER